MLEKKDFINIFLWTVKKDFINIFLWTVKTKKRRSEAKICSKVPNHVTTLNLYKSGFGWTFEALSVPKIISWESPSCRKRTWVNCTSAKRVTVISLTLASPRKKTQVNCTSGGQAMVVQNRQPSKEFFQIWWKSLICVQTLISQAWSGVFQKFKNLEPSEWSALAMEQAPRTVAPLEGKQQLDRGHSG